MSSRAAVWNVLWRGLAFGGWAACGFAGMWSKVRSLGSILTVVDASRRVSFGRPGRVCWFVVAVIDGWVVIGLTGRWRKVPRLDNVWFVVVARRW